MPDTASSSGLPGYNSLVASAEVLLTERRYDPSKQVEKWQDEAWNFYDVLGELRFASNWISNALSRMRLIPATRPALGDEPEPIDSGPEVDLMDALAGGVEGQTSMLASFGAQLTVPGVGYLLGREGGSGKELEWGVYSSDEIRLRSKQFELRVGEKTWEQTGPNSLTVKVWRPHERYHWRPDSATRAALPILREIKRADDQIDAQQLSRLAGAGLLLLAQELSLPVPDRYKSHPDPLTAMLFDVMSTAIRDRGTAAALVPLIMRIPADLIEKAAKLITFETPLNAAILDIRDKAIRRAATAMDFPAEILLGLGDINHWGQWQIQETGIKIHLEPIMQIIVHALTIGYMQPALRSEGRDNPDSMVWYDPSDLTTRPDLTKPAIELHKDMVIGAEATRRESGFSETDAPTDDEELRYIVLQILDKVPTLAPLLLPSIGIDMPVADVDPLPSDTSPAPNSADQVPPDQQLPAQGPPPTQDQAPPPPGPPPGASVTTSITDARLIAADSLVHRALERAGNRLRSMHRGKLNGNTDCDPEHMHVCLKGISSGAATLLQGAWDRVPEVAAQVGVHPAEFESVLHAYCCDILARGLPHDVSVLEQELRSDPYDRAGMRRG